MITLESWFRHSLIYRFAVSMIHYLNNSYASVGVEYIGKIITDSKTAQALRFFATRPFLPERSLFYRILESANKKSADFRDKAAWVLRESRTYKILSDSKSYRLITAMLIPMVAFYPFIDEIGRDILGSSQLFNLWDEAYLLICAIYVFCVWFFKKQRVPLKSTPVGIPIVFLISVSFYLLIMNTTFTQLGIDGFRVVVQYVLWFFVLNSYLDDDRKADLITRLIVYAGGAMGLHGILQYIMKVPTPSSWTDYAEGSTGTRVFSIVGSPNILGSIFILLIPICLALLLQRERSFTDRLVYFVLLGAMGVSLLLTLSRGAWIGAAVAMVVFCLAINPRWLFILGAGGSVMLFIPKVSSRILYLLSPKYMVSSMTGGRLLRYQRGIELFQRNELMGVGLGHFGGAVAMNNRNLVPDTFYMDSYWLKTAVEMGMLGLIAFGVVILALTIWSIRSIKQSKDYDARLITAGCFAGLCGVLFHNIFENIFEVPYMVVYFWVVASILLRKISTYFPAYHKLS